jgi:CRISPR/Cas system CMR subunit Cmr4 (Cas7 group RAMP superfamily)
VKDLAKRTALVSDRSFHHFVTHATQVLQHNRLDAAKVVASGQLFSVEAVPPEAVFYGFLGATRPRRPKAEKEEAEKAQVATREEALAALLAPFSGAGGRPYLQLGGDEGTGLGVTRLTWADRENPAAATAEAPHAS